MALLKVDIDKPYINTIGEVMADLCERVELIESNLRIKFKMKDYMSKGGNIHVVLETDAKLCDLEICCLQAILGSDWIRETHNLHRIRRGQRNWNILFEHEEVVV